MRTGGAELLPGLPVSVQLGVSHGVHPVCSGGHATPINMWPAPQSHLVAWLGAHWPFCLFPQLWP